MMSIGLIAGPLIGSAVYSVIGNFNKTCDIFGFMCVGYTLIFLFGNFLPDFCKQMKNGPSPEPAEKGD